MFISAGVETVSRHVKGSSDSLPDTMNPLFGDARARTATAAKGGAEGWPEMLCDIPVTIRAGPHIG